MPSVCVCVRACCLQRKWADAERRNTMYEDKMAFDRTRFGESKKRNEERRVVFLIEQDSLKLNEKARKANLYVIRNL